MSQEEDFHFSQLAYRGIKKIINQGKKIAIIVNKKGYTHGTICRSCGHVPQCRRCSVPISFHQIGNGDKIGLCHICKTQYNLPKTCEKCGAGEIKEYGMGAQKVAERVEQEFEVKSVLVHSENTNSPNKIAKILEQISKYQIIIGTSLLTTPAMGINFDLVIYMSADLGLNIPDYSINERNFWFLYEGFIKHPKASFVVQTFNPQQYSIRQACKMDEKGFYKIENEFRKKNLYPPFGELCVLMYKNEVEKRVFNQVDKLYKELLFLQQKYGLEKDVEIFSTPPLIYKVFGKYRYNIILKGTQVRNFMDIVYSKLKLSQRGFKVDWMAGSIV